MSGVSQEREGGVRAAQETPARPQGNHARRMSSSLAAAAVAALVLGVGIGVWLRQHPSARSSPAPLPPRDALGATASGTGAQPSKPASQAAPQRRLRVEVVASAAWGNGPSNLGRTLPREANPEGPKSFAVDAEGRVSVLDAVHQRILVLQHGNVVARVPLPTGSFEDIEMLPDGGYALLDRLGQKAVVFLDTQGRMGAKVPLLGRGVTEAGGVGALLVRGDGTWVKASEPGARTPKLVRIADAKGRPDPERPIMDGWPLADGSGVMQTTWEHPSTVVVAVRRQGTPAAWQRSRIAFPAEISHFDASPSDPPGHIFVVATLLRKASPGKAGHEETDMLVVLGPDGAEVGRVSLPSRKGPYENFRAIRSGPGGALYHMSWDDTGVTIRRIVL